MSTPATPALANTFHDLHHGPAPLVLPNAWDALSARLIQQAGAAAIATTSAGVAWSLGYRDEQGAPAARMLTAAARITAVVDVPVTVDVEAGYGIDPDAVARTVEAILDLGAVGINLEDGPGQNGQLLLDLDRQAERIAAARAAADARGVRLYINARTDVYLRQVGNPADRREHVAHRAQGYRYAGADGLFVPGLLDLDAIAWLAERVGMPLNVMAGPGAPTVAELHAAGAARISIGAWLITATAELITEVARTVLASGGFERLAPAMQCGDLNQLFDLGSPAAAR